MFLVFLSMIWFMSDNNTWNNITLVATIGVIDYRKWIDLAVDSFHRVKKDQCKCIGFNMPY